MIDHTPSSEHQLEQQLQAACARLRVDPDEVEIWRGINGGRWRYRAELPVLEIECFGPDAEAAFEELVENLEAAR